MNPSGSVSITQVSELLALTESDRRWGCEILDLRSGGRAASCHLPGSASLPLGPGQDFASALPAHMLAPAGSSLIVLDETAARARAAAEHLAGRGYRARWFAGELEGLPWQPGPSSGALWSPDPFLADHLSLLPEPVEGRVADWGAGNGRNAVFLASQGYRVHCYDRLPDTLALARDRARRHGLKEFVTTHQEMLGHDSKFHEAPFAAILMIRFHEKSLMEGLRAWLRPGGVVLVHTYAQAPRLEEGVRGPRRARYHLTVKEAERLFPAREWTFLERSGALERPDEPMIAFVARPRGSEG